jgi:hypothetical protein
MTTGWRGSNVGCLGVWLTRQPFPERRVDAVVQACEAEQRRGQ